MNRTIEIGPFRIQIHESAISNNPHQQRGGDRDRCDAQVVERDHEANEIGRKLADKIEKTRTKDHTMSDEEREGRT
jgi:hypothetical protein